MKKIFILGLLFFLSTSLTWALSTCETRVDKHPYSSTIERVEYCLNEEPEEDNKPKIVTYTVTTYTQQNSRPQRKSSRGQSYFKNKRVKVTRTYVPTDRFPTWENEILNEQGNFIDLQPEDDLWQEPVLDYELGAQQPAQIQGVFVEEPSVTTTTTTTSVTNTQGYPASSRVHGVLVSTTQQSRTEDEAEYWSFNKEGTQPGSTVTKSRTVTTKTISTTAPQTPAVVSKTIETTAAPVKPVSDTFDEADRMFNETASEALGRTTQAYEQVQNTAKQGAQEANAMLVEAADKTIEQPYTRAQQTVQQAEQRAQQTAQQAEQRAQQTAQDAYDRAVEKANRAEEKANQAIQRAQQKTQNVYDRAEQNVTQQAQRVDEQLNKPVAKMEQNLHQAAQQTQNAADQAWREADELLNNWNY